MNRKIAVSDPMNPQTIDDRIVNELYGYFQ